MTSDPINEEDLVLEEYEDLDFGDGGIDGGIHYGMWWRL